MRNDFVFEFPRPTMPNVVYMGGFQCKPSKPLPQHLEEFVQSSGEHGVIIMSMGAFVGQLPHDVTEEIAAAFAQLPQKIIWRHTGKRPDTLGNNTLLVNWMPQNDLLGHPKTRVFVAHGGTNGVLEAVCHGVPMVGLPLMFDQPDNLSRMKIRGTAKIVDIGNLDRGIFLQALQEVLHEPSYRMNMQRLSRLHLDQPMKPLDRAVFWIEFVMRHKGAAHLRTESYKMPWYAYHSVDVIVVLLSIAADIWLMRNDFVFEFPRPTMPNIVYMGGFQCKPSKPLPQHLEEFVQSSGEHGALQEVLHEPSYRMNMQRLSKLHLDQPMKPLDRAVFWIEFVMRHKGAAHLRTESYKMPWYAYHSVDVVVVLLSIAADIWLMRNDFVFEFPRPTMPNVVYMGGFQCKPSKPLPQHLEEFVQSSGEHGALQEVLHEPSYRMNMQRLSKLHLDQPMKPLDRAVFWIEFVMRHKGAAHLRTESYKMPWYAYHSVDVVVVLLSIISVLQGML
ncbi:hypothetical protein JZ751_018229 [Albula glossodonta]|uniref:UDP-glucuronosyltransferase n=1 Tax=Albula glossodonta TaxID=121402 RepID=A0A8T2NWE8_9TELE|nr:hypothetical protein JZ751_018229 [Albula glossodonta]